MQSVKINLVQTDIVWVDGRGRMLFLKINFVQSLTLCGLVAEEKSNFQRATLCSH